MIGKALLLAASMQAIISSASGTAEKTARLYVLDAPSSFTAPLTMIKSPNRTLD